MDGRQSSIATSDDFDVILRDEAQVAEQEARNGLLQFDEVNRLTSDHAPAMRLDLSTELICDLNRIAVRGIRHSAGMLRRIPVSITNTSHKPPPPEEVPEHMIEMCKYVNDRWGQSNDRVGMALHLSAYLMWRLNWIHPFRDGNGRTSRAVSYLALGVGLGRELIGTPTIADQIVDNKGPYYRALDAADAAWGVGKVGVHAMETLLGELLYRQLASQL